MWLMPETQNQFSIWKPINIMQHISGIIKNLHMITSLNSEEELDKIQHFFMIKNVQQTWNK